MPTPACDPYDIFPITVAFWLVLTVCGVAYLKKNTEKDLLSVAIAFPIFVTAILGVMLSDGVSCIFQGLFGTTKTEVIKFLGLGISGVIAVYGFTVLNRRAVAQEKGIIQDRLKAAIDHLSNKKSVSARMASFYEFFYLARDEQDYAENILGILCAHLRHTSNDEKSKQELTEQQTLIDILFSPKAENIFGEFDYHLQRARLSKIDFQKMHKPNGEVDFSDANLSDAIFDNMDLSSFIFQNATLLNTKFRGTNLQKADLRDANLIGANLILAELIGANLSGADLSDANLIGTNLIGANLIGANLIGTELISAKLLMADLSGADLSGAKLLMVDLSGADLRGTNFHKAKWLEEAILSGAKYNEKTIFPSGFSIPEDMIKTE